MQVVTYERLEYHENILNQSGENPDFKSPIFPSLSHLKARILW